jgi:hypothetical protein
MIIIRSWLNRVRIDFMKKMKGKRRSKDAVVRRRIKRKIKLRI